jgi:hypothetical protein
MIVRFARLAAGLAAAAAIAACASPFAPQYEYEEQLYLSVDGQATVIIHTSLHALVALRGVAIDPSTGGPTDRDAIRRVYETAGCRVDRVGRMWQRSGRRFAQVRVTTDDVRTLSLCRLLSWSSYAMDPIEPGGLRYRQTVGGLSDGLSEPGGVKVGESKAESKDAGWDGNELVAFKLHLPSRIRAHNVKLLNGENGTQERGNILTWEQRLTDRRAGKPLVMDVTMDSTSILNTTLWIFGGAFAAAVAVLVLIIWMVIRRGKNVTWTTG